MIVTIAGSPFTFYPNAEEIGGINLEFAAFDGEVGNGQFPIPDPSAALAGVTGTQFMVEQDFALLTNGFILDQDRQRGPFRVGTMREYQFSVSDANAVLDGFRIVNRHRPAETDYARVLAFAAADLPDLDTTWVLNASTVTMPAKTYDSDGGWTSELIPDLLAFTGKTLFVVDKADGSGRELHYHTLTSGRTCGLSISDVVTAQNGVTVFAPIDPHRSRTSIDLRNNVLATDQKGRRATATDTTSIDAHDADGIRHQQRLITDAVSQTDLQQQANAYLASFKDDLDTWECDIGPLDGTALGLIRVGDLITTTSSVMGLTATAKRISHMRLRPFGDDPNKWIASLELGAPIRRRARVRPSGITNTTEHAPIPSSSIYAAGCYPADSFGTWEAITTTADPNESVLPTLAAGSSVAIGPTIDTITPPTEFFGGGAGLALPPPFDTPPAEGHWQWDEDGYVIVSCKVDIPVFAGGGSVAASLFIAAKNQDLSHSDVMTFDTSNSGSLSVPPVPSDVLPTGDIYNIKARLSASGSEAKVWPTSQSEPVAWTAFGSGAISTGFISGWAFTMEGFFAPTWPQTVTFNTIEFCVGASGTIAYYAIPFGPVSIGQADGITATYEIPAYPPGSMFTVKAFLNGNYEPSTYDDTTREITFTAGVPTFGDDIDVEFVPV